MTGTEENAWYWCAGVLFGEVLAFWFGFDVDYYRLFWPVGLLALIIWAIVRRGDKYLRQMPVEVEHEQAD